MYLVFIVFFIKYINYLINLKSKFLFKIETGERVYSDMDCMISNK